MYLLSASMLLVTVVVGTDDKMTPVHTDHAPVTIGLRRKFDSTIHT